MRGVWVWMLLWGLGGAAMAEVSLRELSMTPGEDGLDIRIEVSGKLEHKIMRLSDPERLVVDVMGETEGDLTHLEKTPLKAPVLALRHSKTAERLRLVLDLQPGAWRVKTQVMPTDDLSNIVLIVTVSPEKKRAVATAPQKMRDLIVVVDPGHGGKDPGAIGKLGVQEKDIVFSVAKRLVDKINRTPGMKAYLTRDKDHFLKLRQRTAKAHEFKADIFLSIHADAAGSDKPMGASVYILSKSGASSELARILENHENGVDTMDTEVLEKAPKDLVYVLSDLTQDATLKASRQLGLLINANLKNVGPLFKNEVERAAFVVLKSADIPSALIELGFLTNVQDERRLMRPQEQERMAEAIRLGLTQFATSYAPKDTRLMNLDAITRHQVVRGETLSSIARDYAVSIRALREANQLATDQLRVGQSLTIPER